MLIKDGYYCTTLLIYNGSMESRKKLIWLLMLIGGVVGGFLPTLWGAGMLSLSSVVLTALGGFAGIWLGFKLSG